MPKTSSKNDNFSISREYSARGFMAAYNAIYADRGWRFPSHFWPVAQALADDRIYNLMVILGPGSTKSQCISITYPAWLLGHDPTQTVIGVSGGEDLVQGFMRSAMEIIDHNKAYRSIFPHIRPDKDAGWSSERGMYVTGRKSGIPDPSYAAYGLQSKALVGKHARTLIFDDLHNKDNSATAGQCMKVKQTYYNTLIGRADPGGARFIIVGRRWNVDDLYGDLASTGEWVTMVLPAQRPGQTMLYWDITVPDGMECCFTENQEGQKK